MLLDFGSPKRAVVVLVAAVLMTACGAPDGASTSPASGEDSDTLKVADATPVLSYTDAFIFQPPGGRDMTMAGLTLSIEGGSAELVAVESPVAESIEMHTVSMQDGTMKMRQVDSLPVDAESPLSLQRGGDHLMVFGLSEPLTPGETIDITLSFETEAGPTNLVVEAEIRSLGD
ncbi:MAG: copper chaperone PCu(A)C [Pseudomonadota bacterium]